MQAAQESLPDEGGLLRDSVYQDEQSIDFYGKNQGSTEHQDYGERYESILSHGANQNLQANKNMLNS
jgi:hypothetical protein